MKLHTILNNISESANQSQQLFHATYRPLLKSIMETGLGGGNRKNWEDSRGDVVYLADDPDVAESYAETSDMVPESWLDKIIILKIDPTVLNPSLLSTDRNNLNNDTLEYNGIIPPSAITIFRVAR